MAYRSWQEKDLQQHKSLERQKQGLSTLDTLANLVVRKEQQGRDPVEHEVLSGALVGGEVATVQHKIGYHTHGKGEIK